MGKPTGFMEFEREAVPYRDPLESLKDYYEIYTTPDEGHLQTQGARCMDCGVPFCQSANGCPIDNLIPEWNHLVYQNRWREAIDRLHKTNNFPEFTGRLCPAPCEESCTLNLDDNPVTIKTIECTIADTAWENGWIAPVIAEKKSGKRVAIVGSGPAGLACAQQLARAGHDVTVYEKHAKAGGLLRYGIPDFKMEKHLIDRRQNQMELEGVVICTDTDVGIDITKDQLDKEFDAIILTLSLIHI